MAPNLAIEFHEATVHRIRAVDRAAVVQMTVYVHSSEGRPGFDAGTGWYQAAEMVLSDAVTEREPSTWPLHLYDGIVAVDSERFANLVPLPFERTGRVRVEFQGADGWFGMSGDAVRIELEGTPGQPEEFPGIAP